MLFDMVPRLLGQFLPEIVRKTIGDIFDSRLIAAAQNFAPLGHFHILLGDQQMQSRPVDNNLHALSLSLQQTEALHKLIQATSVEGGLAAAHGMLGYAECVSGILKGISVCEFGGQPADYEATLCQPSKLLYSSHSIWHCMSAPCLPSPALYTIVHMLSAFFPMA